MGNECCANSQPGGLKEEKSSMDLFKNVNVGGDQTGVDDLPEDYPLAKDLLMDSIYSVNLTPRESKSFAELPLSSERKVVNKKNNFDRFFTHKKVDGKGIKFENFVNNFSKLIFWMKR